MVEHVREADGANFLRHAVCGQAVQHRVCIGAVNLDLCKGGDIHDADAFTNGLHLGCDNIVNGVALERVVVVLRNPVPRKPAWAFEAVHLFVHSALGFQKIVQRRRLDRTPRQPVEMRERDFVTEAVVFLGFDHLPVFRGIAAEPARIIIAHRNVGSAMHHPASKLSG